MKKVIIAFDGTGFASSSFQFAVHLNSIQPILLTGVFLPQTDLASLWSRGGGGGTGGAFIPLMEEVEAEVVQRNIETFSKLCVKNNIEFRVHRDVMDFALPELTHETRFADLLLISSESFYSNTGANAQVVYLQEALTQAECPVIVVPGKPEPPASIVLAYDGSRSSVFAIKQFAYLFPELTSLPTLLVYVTEKDDEFPDEVNIEELAARHYPSLSLFKLEIDPKKYFATWISEKKGALLVAGSFGRSDWSRLFRSSFIQHVINEHSLPVFIAHA
jgi:hypothetical protein